MAWHCQEPTGHASLEWGPLELAAPAVDEVLIEVRSASLNFPDALMVQNLYQIKPALPFVPGSELAGIVVGLGSAVEGLEIGQRVACFSGTGAFATHALVPAKHCVPLLAEVSFTQAAAFLTTYGTAYHALIGRARLTSHDTVLVLGAAGGVGTAAIQIAKAMGANVVAATSSADKCALSKSLGADRTINYSDGDFPKSFRAAIAQASAGTGPTVVFDPVGGDLTEPAFRSIAWDGRYLVVGFAGGSIPSLPLNLPLLKGASVMGVFWAEFMKRQPGANQRMLDELVLWIAKGKLAPVIHASLPMSELKRGFDMIVARSVMGKIVFEIPSS